MLDKIPQPIQQIAIAALYLSLGASGREFVGLMTPKPQTSKFLIIVKSESTKKSLSDAEVKILVNGAPINLKTDSNGYAEAQIQTRDAIQAEVTKMGYKSKSQTLNLAETAEKPFEISLSIDQLSPNCFGDSCTDRIPTAAKCNTDATTTNYATGEQFKRETGLSNVVRVELRYSPKCNAVWAKTVAPANSILYLQDESSSKYSEYKIPQDESTDHHNEMVSGDLRIRACVQSSQGTSAVSCTGFVQSSAQSNP
jgi:hypothetical protein